MWDAPPEHPLRRLFAGLTEHAFLSNLGVADPPLIDYLSGLLARFVHSDTVFRLKDGTGHALTELAVMATEADKLPADGRTRREYHRHVGDFALFWTGLFPEASRRLQHGPFRDQVVGMTTLGKRSYGIAGGFDRPPFADEAPVLRRLGEQFELCAYGLREVRREWEEIAAHPPSGGLIGT
jgi:hypothetical protein